MTLDLTATETLRGKVLALGFDRVGFAAAERVADYDRYQAWLDAGQAGGMEYMHRNCCLREDPRELLAEARSLILVSMNYHWPGEDRREPGRGQVSRYARGRDYHKVLRGRLRRVESMLREEFGAGATRICVDSAPLLERSLAAAAGLGWIGKNTLLIDEKIGSWTFLGALLCDLDLPPDSPVADRCGNCTACLDACPTEAFPEPGVLDAGRCISYLTIEHKGKVPVKLAVPMGDHVFGCDICQEVCPWNQKAPATGEADFEPRPQVTAPLLSELLSLDESSFLDRFAGTPVMRAGLEGMKRNATIARENAESADCTRVQSGSEVTIRPLGDGDSLVALTEILNRAYAQLADMGFRYVATWQDEEITRRRVGRGECLVAEVDGRIVGTLLLEYPARGAPYYESEGVAKFQQFGLEPGWQGRGIGRGLLERAEILARERGARELALDTAEGATHLIEMYERWGYRLVGEADWEVTNYRSVIMSKEL